MNQVKHDINSRCIVHKCTENGTGGWQNLRWKCKLHNVNLTTDDKMKFFPQMSSNMKISLFEGQSLRCCSAAAKGHKKSKKKCYISGSMKLLKWLHQSSGNVSVRRLVVQLLFGNQHRVPSSDQSVPEGVLGTLASRPIRWKPRQPLHIYPAHNGRAIGTPDLTTLLQLNPPPSLPIIALVPGMPGAGEQSRRGLLTLAPPRRGCTRTLKCIVPPGPSPKRFKICNCNINSKKKKKEKKAV
jgi:hypothetical protein